MDNSTRDMISFRRRSVWESFDLGVHLVVKRLFFYMALYFIAVLPLYVLSTIIFFDNPTWSLTVIWWLKPAFEAGLVLALSKQVLGENPSFSGSLKSTWRLCFRYRIIGDLLLRRLSTKRAIILPITVLEKVSGERHRKRRQQISYRTGSASSWLMLFGVHFEAILLYGCVLLLSWILFKDLSQNFLPKQPVNYKYIEALADWFIRADHHWIWHVFNLLYVLVLSFWEPFFVAMCFALYLQVRTETEAWDIGLVFNQLAERLRNISTAILIGLIFSGSVLVSDIANAETLPDRQQVEETRQKSIGSKPFGRIETQNSRVWKRKSSGGSRASYSHAPSLGNILLFILIISFLGAALYLIWKLQLFKSNVEDEKPQVVERIFGMDVRRESLPENLTDVARNLAKTDARAAISLLYRALLVHLIHQERATLRDSMTEQEILNLVQVKHIHLTEITERFTKIRIASAYAHIQANEDEILQLCNDYDNLIRNSSIKIKEKQQ